LFLIFKKFVSALFDSHVGCQAQIKDMRDVGQYFSEIVSCELRVLIAHTFPHVNVVKL